MRIFIYILSLILLIPSMLYAACGGTSPYLTAASASQSDVMDCINAATYGDTINVPAGSETWTAASQGCTGDSMICMKKGINLKGAGSASTIITLSGSAPYGAINYEPDSTSLTNDTPFEFTGFTVDAGGVNYAEGMLDIRNSGTTVITKVKIHHNIFKNGGSDGHAITINGAVYGVAYLNTVQDIGTFVKVEGGNSKSWDLGHREYGKEYSFFAEDNSILFTSSTTDDFGSTAGQGGSLVFRYNTINAENNTTGNELFDMHGLQSMSSSNSSCNGGCDGSTGSCYTQTTGGTKCCNEWSQVKSELYGNSWINLGNTSGGYSYWLIHRGSWLMMFLNNSTGTYSGGSTPQPKYREYACDECANGTTESMHIQNTYLWSNLYNGTNKPLVPISNLGTYGGDYCASGVGTYAITENTDFWNYNASFNGTSGVGCGTLANLPATCTTGVGYWATNQKCDDLTGMVGANPATPISGTLYKCTSTDTWEAYYTPYTYPHPLRVQKFTGNVMIGGAGLFN